MSHFLFNLHTQSLAQGHLEKKEDWSLFLSPSEKMQEAYFELNLGRIFRILKKKNIFEPAWENYKLQFDLYDFNSLDL